MIRKSVYLLYLFAFLILNLGLVMNDPNPPGNLKVFIGISDSPRYIEEWVAKQPSESVRVPYQKEFFFGEILHIAFIATGYSLEENSKMNLSVDYQIIDPDGKKISNELDYAETKAVIDAKPSFVMMFPALDLWFDEEEKAGRYKIIAIAHDHISGKSVEGEADFNLMPWDEKLVANQSLYYSEAEAERLLKEGKWLEAATHAFSLYPVDHEASLRIAEKLRTLVTESIENFLFRAFRESLIEDPSLKLPGEVGGINADWVRQKAAWSDLFIQKVMKK